MVKVVQVVFKRPADIFNAQKVNFSEQQLLASIIANAIGRREDQLAIDVMDAAGTSLTVATSIGGAFWAMCSWIASGRPARTPADTRRATISSCVSVTGAGAWAAVWG